MYYIIINVILHSTTHNGIIISLNFKRYGNCFDITINIMTYYRWKHFKISI